jgi:ubiquinone/menaquinone biosynthesis C-methylase UbiE
MNSKKVSGKINLAYAKYLTKVLTTNLLKSTHNLLYRVGIDIRFRKKEILFGAIEHNSVEEVNKFYSSADKQFEITSSAHQKFFHEIIKIIEKQGINLKGKIIADFGCGIGNLLYHFNDHFQPSSCYGFDFSEILLKLALKRFPEGRFKQHDIYTILDQKFDFIFCTEVIEHLLYPDKALKNILATVQLSGGGAFISVPDGRKDTFAGHINFWSPESWEVFIKRLVDGKAKVITGYVTPNNLFAIVLFDPE